MTEKGTLLSFNNEDEKIIADSPEKRTKRILISLSAFLVVIGLILFVLLSPCSNDDKKENLKLTIDYTNREHRQLSETFLKSSKANNIKAIYDCPGNNETCQFYYVSYYNPYFINFTSLISSISIDGESVPIQDYYKFENPGVREVIIEFKEKVENLHDFFLFSKYLISVDLSNFDASELTNMEALFYQCGNLKSIIWGSNFSTSKVTNMKNLFFGCSNLDSIDLTKFNTAKVTTFNGMFYGCSSLKELDVSSFDTSSATDFSIMFSRCKLLTTIDLSSFKSDKVNSMNFMFQDCSSLETVNFGDNFNTKSVNKMMLMFSGCSSLKKINFDKNFDTRNVIDMSGMFKDCRSLENLDLSIFNTTILEDAGSMFENCENLVNIEQHFTFENLINSKSMFYNCRNLEKINLSGIVAKNLDNASSMFVNCNSLTSIDLRNLVAGQIKDTDKIFDNLPDTGNLVYNSLKLNPNFLVTLPSGWTRTDVKSSR